VLMLWRIDDVSMTMNGTDDVRVIVKRHSRTEAEQFTRGAINCRLSFMSRCPLSRRQNTGHFCPLVDKTSSNKQASFRVVA